MKKFIGVLVAVIMCVAMCVPFASAAADSSALDSLAGLLEGVDVSSLTDGELSELLGGLDLGNIDLSALTDQLGDIGGSSGSGIGDSLAQAGDNIEADMDEVDVGGEVEDALSSVLGETDLSSLEGLLGDFDIQATLDDLLGGLTGENSGDFVSTITGVFEGLGLGEMDLGSFDVGSFDISSVLGGITGGDSGSNGGDSGSPTDANPSSNAMAGIADMILGGLQSLGIDTSIIEGLLDNEIVNFFANMYIGFQGKVDETTTAPETTTEPTTLKPVTTTEKLVSPKTGDSSQVLVAIGALSVAAAAAFVCMKKKRA